MAPGDTVSLHTKNPRPRKKPAQENRMSQRHAQTHPKHSRRLIDNFPCIHVCVHRCSFFFAPSFLFSCLSFVCHCSNCFPLFPSIGCILFVPHCFCSMNLFLFLFFIIRPFHFSLHPFSIFSTFASLSPPCSFVLREGVFFPPCSPFSWSLFPFSLPLFFSYFSLPYSLQIL